MSQIIFFWLYDKLINFPSNEFLERFENILLTIVKRNGVFSSPESLLIATQRGCLTVLLMTYSSGSPILMAKTPNSLGYQ